MRRLIGVLALVLVACGGGGAEVNVTYTDEDGSESIAAGTLACTGDGALGVECSWGEPNGTEHHVMLQMQFSTSFAAATEGTVLRLGADFTIDGVAFFGNSNGFGAGGQDIAEGDLAITIGARTSTIAVTIDGELHETAGWPGGPFSVTFEAVAAAFPTQ